MAFTYVGDLSTNRDNVRFYIQDTVSGSGPKPSDGNFTDAEIDGLITLEGGWERAVAGAFETLSSAWSTYANIRVGPRSEEYSKIADAFLAQADRWRRRYGATTTGAGSRHVTRIDGYTDDVASDAT